ncbi:LysR substrate-binding domain-containing protein [Micromonosporaceae bacterium B7E4]
MLDTDRLRVLAEVARTGAIARAAERLGCTAAAASQQISRLERETGAVLLERSARSVRLTEAGRVLATHAERVFAELDAADQAVRAVAGVAGGRLRVASFATSRGFVVPALAAFARRHPGIELDFVEMEPEHALPAVRAGNVDVAVAHRYAQLQMPDLRGLRETPLHREALLVAVPARLAPATDEAVHLQQFADAPWGSTLATNGYQAVTELACYAAGFEPRVDFRADSYDLLLALVGIGFGVALVPALVARPAAGIRFLEIAQPSGLARDLQAVTRRADTSPAAVAMIDCLTRQLRHRRPSSPSRARTDS